MNINLRDYQIKCKRAIKENFDKGINKQLIVAATGTGKRIMAIDLAKHFKRVLFVAHREELIMQAYNDFEKFYPLQSGIVKGPAFDIENKITVASVQTLYNRLDRIPRDYYDLVLIDEAHHYMSKTYFKVVRHFNSRLRTSWTATPKRLDGLSLSNIAQEIVFQYKIEDGIKDGYLCNIDAYQIKTSSDISKVKRTGGDFNQKYLSIAVNSDERNELIVQKYKQYTEGRQGIAFCVDIDHALDLRDKFRKYGYKAETIVSDKNICPNREELISEFRNKEIDILTNVNILTEGFDYEDVGVVLMARPTESEALYIQCIGRGTRLKSKAFIDKFKENKCIILDFVDNTGKHRLVNAWELEKDMKIEDRLFVPKEHKEKLIAERKKRERYISIKAGSDRKVNLIKLPKVSVWNSPKMEEPATEKQLKWLKDIGMYQEGLEYTKAMASELIGNQPAKQWQVFWLAKHNYDVSRGVTLAQYQRVKWIYDRKNKYSAKKD